MQVFRIFLSSTFLDFRKERHLLHTLVFPALEKKFAHAGIELEVIDLRWGVNETDARTQDTLELCLDEILRCQRLTEKPNFLGLMGGRVGWRPLPNILGQNLYDALYELADDTGEKQVLETWYKPDITVLNNDARRFSALVEPGESVRILAPTTTDPEEKAAWARAEKTLRALFDAYSIRVLSHSGKRDSILALCASATFQMGWTASMRHQCAMMRSEDHSEETARMKVTIIGLDIAKSVFQVHGTDASGKCLLKKKLGRSEVISFFEKLERCLVVLEACSTSHHWARVIRDTGHEVKLIPPEMVKPFVKRGKKNDAVDAAAICLAAIHPDTRFVPIKNREQQSLLSLHSTRTLLVKQQTMLVNALRALAAEFGLIVPLGNARLPELLAKIETSSNLPDALKQTTMLLFEQYGRLNESIENLEGGIRTHAKQDEDARRLLTIPGIGPVTASLIVASVTDIGAFDTARHFAAWLGLVPRQHSSGGKTRLGRITKTGNREIRKMLVLGATSMLYRAQKWDSAAGVWLCKLLERRPGRLATVALANKLARIIWVLLSRKEIYRPAGRSVAIV
ncbi:IS110 family transposase [Komagataeibacter sp. FNDCR1]|nr:IS110 family transposase [Komagataeibacter sp. FNDCR1]